MVPSPVAVFHKIWKEGEREDGREGKGEKDDNGERNFVACEEGGSFRSRGVGSLVCCRAAFWPHQDKGDRGKWGTCAPGRLHVFLSSIS